MICKIKAVGHDLFADLAYFLADCKWTYEVIPSEGAIYVLNAERKEIEEFVTTNHIRRERVLISEL